MSSNSSTSSLPSLANARVPPQHPSQPLSISRLGAAVDALFRPPAKGKPPRPRDPLALFILFSLFLTFFLLLLILLLTFKSAAAYSAASNAALVTDNLARIKRGQPPTQFWPLPDSRQRALAPKPTPVALNIAVPDIFRARRFPPRSSTAFRDSKYPLRLSVVIACKDRTAYLQTILPRILSLIHPTRDEVILVDWGSTPPDAVPLAEVVRASSDQRVSVVSLTHPAPWALSRAYNLGFGLARGQFTLKLDSDTLLLPDFFEKHPYQKLPPDAFYHFRWGSARNPNEAHLSGIFLVRTAHLRGVNGFDERITTYGWDDSDLYARLQVGVKGGSDPQPALTAWELNPIALQHIEHSDSLRAAGENDAAPMMQTQVNSQAVAAVTSWTDVGAEQRMSIRFDLLSRDARFIAATIEKTPKPILHQLDAAKRAEIEAEATNRVLHDSFGLPWCVLSETNRDRPHLLRALSAYASTSSRWSPDRGVVIAELRGSTPSRVVTLASVVALARRHNRPLFIAWGAVDGDIARRTADAAAVKVTDIFHVDDDSILSAQGHAGGGADGPFAVTDHMSSRLGPPVFVLGQVRCQTEVEECGKADPAFKKMVEFRTDRTVSASADGKTASDNGVEELDAHSLRARVDAVEATLRGETQGKNTVLVRLSGIWPGRQQTRQDRDVVLSKLRLAEGVQKRVDAAAAGGDLGKHICGFLGRSLRAHGVEAMVHRLRQSAQSSGGNDGSTGGLFFFSGENAELVAQARAALPSAQKVAAAVGATEADVGSADEQVARAVARSVAELAMLARCREVVNDGRPPNAILEVIDIWRKQVSASQER